MDGFMLVQARERAEEKRRNSGETETEEREAART
jgi:hypothetical protein